MVLFNTSHCKYSDFKHTPFRIELRPKSKFKIDKFRFFLKSSASCSFKDYHFFFVLGFVIYRYIGLTPGGIVKSETFEGKI